MDLSTQVYLTLFSSEQSLARRVLVEETNSCDTLGDRDAIAKTLASVGRIAIELKHPKLDTSTIISFLRNNDRRPLSSYELQQIAKSTVPAEYYRNMTYKDWGQFYVDFPNCSGYASLSNVGLDSSSKWALVYCETGSGPTGIYGYFYHLQLYTTMKWNIVGRYGVWDS